MDQQDNTQNGWVEVTHKNGKRELYTPANAAQFIEEVYLRAPGLAAQCHHVVMTGDEIPQMSAAVARKLGGKS